MNREKRYEELADKVDNLESIDQKFILWLLLARYIDKVERDWEWRNDPRKTSKDIGYAYYKGEQLRILPHVRDDIANDLW